MADLAIVALVFLTTIGGLRRGFFKEAIAILALVGATWIAIRAYPVLGPIVAGTAGLSADLGYAAAGIGAWIVGYFFLLVVGRLFVKFLKRGPKGRMEEAADRAAEALAGRSLQGPISKVMRAFPTRAGIVYWIDKVLGAALGVAKGTLVGLVALLVATQTDGGKVGAALRASAAMGHYKAIVEPELDRIPEMGIVRSIGSMRRIVSVVREHPDRMDRVLKHPAITPVRQYAPVQEVAEDRDLQVALEHRDIAEALKNRKLLALLHDREFFRRVGLVDWKLVLQDVQADEPPSWLEPRPPERPGSRRVPAGARPGAAREPGAGEEEGGSAPERGQPEPRSY